MCPNFGAMGHRGFWNAPSEAERGHGSRGTRLGTEADDLMRRDLIRGTRIGKASGRQSRVPAGDEVRGRVEQRETTLEQEGEGVVFVDDEGGAKIHD